MPQMMPSLKDIKNLVLLGFTCAGIVFFVPSFAYAACSGPAGNAGEITYDTGQDRFEYCDNTSWYPMCCGAACVKGTGITCASNGNTCTKQGEMQYDTVNDVMVWCDGSSEFNMDSTPDNIPTSGLVGYWTLDEGTGTTAADSAGGDDNGTLLNTPTWTTDKFDGGLDFNKADEDAVQITGLFGKPTNVTLAAWVSLNANGWDTVGSHIVTIGDYVMLELTAADQGTNEGLQLVIYDSGVWKRIMYDDTNLDGAGWIHIAGVFDDTNNIARVFLNGVEVTTTVVTYSIDWAASLGTDTYIGRHGDSFSGMDMDGKIDDVRIYNRALSATEVADIYNGRPCSTKGRMEYDTPNNVFHFCNGVEEHNINK